MPSLGPQPLLAFARELQRAHSFRELFEITLVEVRRSLGYQIIWFAVKDTEDSTVVRILDVLGAQRDSPLESVTTVPVAGDRMLEEIFAGNAIVLVEDARTDPRTNKAIVEALGNRTILHTPLTILDKPFGALGMGTFGEEGCRVPTPEMLAHLAGLTSIISVAASRLRLEELTQQAERERRELERRLARMQRLDSIGVLAGGVAHDFNNLLTVLSAASGLARGARTPAEIERELDAIEDVVTRGQALTRQLLAMSRTQALELRDIDLNQVLADLVPLLRRVIPETVRIDLTTSHQDVLIEADRTQIDQVIMNLCLNARDAMPEGGRIAIETEVVSVDGTLCEAHPWAKPGAYVSTTISDTGHGISKEHLDRIFDPFFTTKGEHAGTGLGLSVAHGIVQQHGGMLHCSSELGTGTTFQIHLPLLARAARPVGAKVQVGALGGNERILVGEDDAAVRGVVRRILERAGYHVALVPDGYQVGRTLEVEPFDLVLLDVVMPGLSCTETIARVRAIRPSARILLSSGYTADTNVAALLRDQSIPLLPKPYDPAQLLRAIRAELDRA
jgi:signal transduction histidine kinase